MRDTVSDQRASFNGESATSHRRTIRERYAERVSRVQGDVEPKTVTRLRWPNRESDLVTTPLRVAASWSWRFLLVVAAVIVLGYILGYLSTVTIPLAIALLMSALLTPAKNWLVDAGMPNKVAAPLVFVGGLLFVAGFITLVVNAIINDAPKLVDQASGGLEEIQDWLVNGPFHVSTDQIQNMIEQAQEWLQNNQSRVTSGALTAATTLGHFLAGFVLALFSLFFFLRDGDKIFDWCLRLLPLQSRKIVHDAGHRGWHTLGGYIKGTALVALVDGVGIGIGLLIVGVELWLPLAALVFLTAFIPVVGAVLSGALAVLVTLVTLGPVKALIVFGIVLLVQQLESHLLQPIVMSRAVALHPLAIVLALTVGAIVAGIIGALLAVPLAAALNAALRDLHVHPDAHLDETGRIVADQSVDDAPPPAPEDDEARAAQNRVVEKD